MRCCRRWARRKGVGGLDVESLVGPVSFLGDCKSPLGERLLENTVFRVDFTLHDGTGIHAGILVA